jgi:acylphosphatase
VACARFLVSGRVQGVFFRASTREQARALGLSGHAKNLDDGRVEVLACGEPQALDALERWLHAGPPSARVDGVEREPAADTTLRGFETLLERGTARTGAFPKPGPVGLTPRPGVAPSGAPTGS